MRYLTALAALGLVLAVAATAEANSWYQKGGDRLVALQNDDGGWDWPLDDGDPTSASPTNTIGPITMGLIQAYRHTGDAGMLAAINDAGSLLLSKTTFSPADGYLAAALDDVLGGTAHTDYVKTNYYDALAAGTYDRGGTQYDTPGYVDLIQTARSGYGNMAEWDIGIGVVGAAACGADTSDWVQGVKDELNEHDGTAYYDVLGLAGSVYGLSVAGEDFDPTAGDLAGADSLTDLADILAGYQLSTGGLTWNSQYMGEGVGNETIQETAYAILAFSELDPLAYDDAILAARKYLASVQLPTGGWENYTGRGENNEITGEALWAGPVPEPLTMAGLVLGLGSLAGYVRRRRGV